MEPIYPRSQSQTGAPHTPRSRADSLSPLVLSVCLGLWLAPSRVPAQDNQNLSDAARPAVRVIVLQPQVKIERLSPRSQLRVGTGTTTLELLMADAALAELSLRKYTFTSVEALQDSEPRGWLGKLQPLTCRLARGVIDDEARQILKHLGTLPQEYLILAQCLQAEDVRGGSYNPTTGGTRQPMTRTLVQAALISPQGSRVSWKNEILERQSFRADDPKFWAILSSVYGTLENKGNL